MNNLPIDWAVVVAIVIGAVVLRVLKGRGKAPPKVCGYRRRGALLTQAELSFFRVLQQAVGDEYTIFAKVRVADVLKPDRRQEKPEWRAALNRITSKHFDFVICEPASTSIYAIIELNDRSHKDGARAARDTFLREACESAGLRLIEVEARSGYAVARIRELLQASARVADVARETPPGDAGNQTASRMA
jgi:hypothetical protein